MSRGPARSLGSRQRTTRHLQQRGPVVTELAIELGLTLVIYTDGFMQAGARRGETMDVSQVLGSLLSEREPTPQELVGYLLGYAVSLDEGRPENDISVLAMKLVPRTRDDIRRMKARLP